MAKTYRQRIYKPETKKRYRKPDEELTPEERERRNNSLKNLEGHKWKPGQSGNPSGNNTPKEAQQFLKDATYQAVNDLVRIAQSGGSTKQLDAIKEILDRVWGKASQPIDLNPEDKTIQIEFVNGDYGE